MAIAMDIAMVFQRCQHCELFRGSSLAIIAILTGTWLPICGCPQSSLGYLVSIPFFQRKIDVTFHTKFQGVQVDEKTRQIWCGELWWAATRTFSVTFLSFLFRCFWDPCHLPPFSSTARPPRGLAFPHCAHEAGHKVSRLVESLGMRMDPSTLVGGSWKIYESWLALLASGILWSVFFLHL